MSITVQVDFFINCLTGGQASVEVEGQTVGQCLDSLEVRFPGIKSALFNNEGQIWSDIGIFLNNSFTYLSHPVKDGDELTIIKTLTGG